MLNPKNPALLAHEKVSDQDMRQIVSMHVFAHSLPLTLILAKTPGVSVRYFEIQDKDTGKIAQMLIKNNL